MNKYLLIVFVLMTCSGFAQNLQLWSGDILKSCNTGSTATYLSEEEKKVLLLLNLARADGPAFIKNVLTPFVDKTHPPDNAYLKSLYTDLRKTKGIAALQPNQKLSESSLFHANDMGQTGNTGHDSSNGTSCFDRIEKYYKGGAMAENCSYGYDDALNIVMQLLIDDGVRSKGHRYTILNKVYKQVGLSIQPHKTFRWNCVMDFSD